MSILHQAGFVLRVGASVALLGALALASGCMGGETATAAPEEPSAEVAQALSGIFACERSIGPSSLVVRFDGTCFIQTPRALGSSSAFCSGGVCPECWRLAKEVIGCGLQ